MMNGTQDARYFETIVIGGGQAGLSVGYHLARRGMSFVILEGRHHVGDVWRERWDSLRLFTPAGFSGLDGMPFPAPRHSFPTKDEMADYLEAYAAHFELPVRTGMRANHLTRQDGRFQLDAGGEHLVADNVVVAMANYQEPRIPPFAGELDPSIVQVHSFAYSNPGQLRDGPVLIVGAGNSGSEIAMELGRRHKVWLSGRDTGQLPFRVGSLVGRVAVPIVLKGLFHRVLTVRTPIGRRVRRKVLHIGGPLIRVRNRDMARLGIERVPRTTRVEDGRPVLDDGRVLDVTNVVWCTGFRPGFDWIDLPVLDGDDPMHRSGIVDMQPGLYFVGLHFLHALSSAMIHGVGRDAERVASAIAAGSSGERSARPSSRPSPTEAGGDRTEDAMLVQGG
jgi:putative flavoprotein involved in K+ transport